jgi:elongation factor Ts
MSNVITAQLVKDLRDKTGAGMMDCKAALAETAGDLEAAVDWLRTKGLAKAAKKSGRIAAEGLIAVQVSGTKGVAVEVNSETDFVARNDRFQSLSKEIAALALTAGTDVEAIKATKLASGLTVAESIAEAVATIGENMTLRRVAALDVKQGVIGSYVHSAVSDGLGKIGVLVALETEATGEEVALLAKQLAMHVAAASPLALDAASVDSAILEREKAVLTEKAAASGKPANVIEKIVESGVKSYFKEVCFLEQTSIHDGSKTVSQLVAELGNKLGKPIKVAAYVRYVLGEGIEKEESDFAAEVAAAVGVR